MVFYFIALKHITVIQRNALESVALLKISVLLGVNLVIGLPDIQNVIHLPVSTIAV